MSNLLSCASSSDNRTASVMKNSGISVRIGMTETQVLQILGKPRNVNSWKDDNLLYEGERAWHYNKFLFGPYRVVYFKDGLVTQVEEFYK
jgi:hypothetical protein